MGIQNINRLTSDLAYIKQAERKGFVEISDEDLEFKQSELKREKSKRTRKQTERSNLREELGGFREQLADAKKRFEATFHTEPESREAMREQEKRRIRASNRLTQVENEIRGLCEKSLPFALAGKLFDGIRQQIEKERDSATGAAIKESAAELAKRLVRVVEEPEPIYREKLTPEKMVELESRIVRLLKEGDGRGDVAKVLDLSDRDVARVLNQMENLENGEVFLIQPMIEEKRELEAQVRALEGMSTLGAMTESEGELLSSYNQKWRVARRKLAVRRSNFAFWKRKSLPLRSGSATSR